MKQLYVLRHAKSDWNNPEISDFDRPLNPRGLRTAPFMGQLMAERGVRPELIISSPARRAEQTALLVKDSADLDCPLQFDERIYEASPQTLLQVVTEIPANAASAMLVGHNPGMEGIVRVLTGELHPMPTAALAIIHLNIKTWADIAEGTGTLETVYRPKEEVSREQSE